mmetsp:Transcript_4531/g.7627  ORF Transcript_4531/g.7627 Transcript_4531/m.7627 type:complete len:160 (-) Transcript_4531:1134-1613(-)
MLTNQQTKITAEWNAVAIDACTGQANSNEENQHAWLPPQVPSTIAGSSSIRSSGLFAPFAGRGLSFRGFLRWALSDLGQCPQGPSLPCALPQSSVSDDDCCHTLHQRRCSWKYTRVMAALDDEGVMLTGEGASLLGLRNRRRRLDADSHHDVLPTADAS